MIGLSLTVVIVAFVIFLSVRKYYNIFTGKGSACSCGEKNINPKSGCGCGCCCNAEDLNEGAEKTAFAGK